MQRLARAGMAHCAPKLNPRGDPNKYLSDKGAPWKKLANEKPQAETIPYDKVVERLEGRARSLIREKERKLTDRGRRSSGSGPGRSALWGRTFSG